MFEGLNPWENAKQFIDEYATTTTETVKTEISEFDQTNRPLNHLNRLFGYGLRPLLNTLNARGDFIVLDVPCGSKAVAARQIVSEFENAYVAAADIKLDVNDYPVNSRLSLTEVDILKAPSLPMQNADLVICYGFMDYLREAGRDDLMRKVISEISKSLAPGGIALVDTSWDHLTELRDHEERFVSCLIERETQVKITKASRKLSIFVQFSPKFGYRRSVDNNYALISKL